MNEQRTAGRVRRSLRRYLSGTGLLVAILALAISSSACGLWPAGAAQQEQKGGDEAIDLAARVQKFELGTVEYTATWQNPSRSTTAPITFKVQMDTHSGSLDEYDIGRASTLATDAGRQVKASLWSSPGGGHHGAGTLVFPAADASGKALISTETKYVEWTIDGLSGLPAKKIRWEIRP